VSQSLTSTRGGERDGKGGARRKRSGEEKERDYNITGEWCVASGVWRVYTMLLQGGQTTRGAIVDQFGDPTPPKFDRVFSRSS